MIVKPVEDAVSVGERPHDDIDGDEGPRGSCQRNHETRESATSRKGGAWRANHPSMGLPKSARGPSFFGVAFGWAARLAFAGFAGFAAFTGFFGFAVRFSTAA